MTSPTFQKATKRQSRLRMAIDGPSGSGKTFTALTFAGALSAGRVAVIDTERGSASKYADMFDFDVLELDSYAPRNYVEGIKAAEAAGYDVLVIDSLSHAWEGEGGVLDIHEQATLKEAGHNSYTAWRSVTPLHRELVDAMLNSRCHIIATMRSKMDYIQVSENGKTTIRKVGMAPIQRQGMEYEFDVVADMDIEHNLVVSKSRCYAVADAVVKKPTAIWFAAIANWLQDGAPIAAGQAPPAGNNGDGQPQRPYAPAMVTERLRDVARQYAAKGATVTDGQVGAMVGAVEQLFQGDIPEVRKAKRYTFTRLVWGVDSSKKMAPSQVLATLRWAGEKLPDGTYAPDPLAAQEIAKMIEADAVAKAQAPLAMAAQ